MKKLILLIWVGLFLSSVGRADRVVQANIGSPAGGTFPLLLDASLEKLIPLFSRWQERLRPHADVEFLLGAGDLRRALLGMPSDGPGDIEIFIHFNDQNLAPYANTRAMLFLERHGIDLVSEIRQLLDAPHKKVDVFVRDKIAIDTNGPYVTELSVFEGHGDTSVNALTYSPARNTILGADENLEALRRGKIVFLELHKTRLLEDPKEIPITNAARGVKYFSAYPSTILRQDFRATRLAVDLFLQKNYLNGRLSLDEASFETILQGTELYFGDLPPAVVAQFPLYAKDDTYLMVFLKMFRKRTDRQLAQIREFLYARFPKKVALWKQMGLDVDLLTEPRPAGTDVARLEFRATHRNTRYDILRPLIQTDFSIENPFIDDAAFARWATPLKGALPRAIPLEILSLYSAGLHWNCVHFDELSLEEKRQTLNAYQSALAMFSGSAYDRLVKQVSFRNDHLATFGFVRPETLIPKSTISLLDHVTQMRADAEQSGIPAPHFATTSPVNDGVYAELNRALFRAKRANKTPVLVVDLDNSVFETSSRILAILQAYDREMGTHWFSGLKHTDLPIEDYKQFILARLAPHMAGHRQLSDTIDAIWRYVKMKEWDPEFVAKGEANPEMVLALKHFQRKGAKLVFITARKSYLQQVTEDQLDALGLGRTVLCYPRDEERNAVAWKVETFVEWIENLPEYRFIGFLDNENGVINSVRAQLEELIDDGVLSESSAPVIARVHFRHRDGASHAFLLQDESLLYPIHTPCAALIADEGDTEDSE